MQKLNLQCLDLAISRLTLDDEKNFLESQSVKICSRIWHIYDNDDIFDIHMYAYNKEELITKFSKSEAIQKYIDDHHDADIHFLIKSVDDLTSEKLCYMSDRRPYCPRTKPANRLSSKTCFHNKTYAKVDLCVICETVFPCKHEDISSLDKLTEQEVFKLTEWLLTSCPDIHCEPLELV